MVYRSKPSQGLGHRSPPTSPQTFVQETCTRGPEWLSYTRYIRSSITPYVTHLDADADENDGYYPGLVNISGTYCFMNSTLQVRLQNLSFRSD